MAIFSQNKGNNVKFVAGEGALDNTNPTPVVSGLRTIYSVALTLKVSTAPGDNTQVLTYDVVGGTVNVYGWKNTNGSDPTLAASTGTEAFGYIIVGR